MLKMGKRIVVLMVLGLVVQQALGAECVAAQARKVCLIGQADGFGFAVLGKTTAPHCFEEKTR